MKNAFESGKPILAALAASVIGIGSIGIVRAEDAPGAVFKAASAQVGPAAGSSLGRLLAEALEGNAEIRAARGEREAARQRIAPAGALDDPMLEAGFLNVPTSSWRLNREDMTMKMLGISQRVPAAGKRALRQEVAARDAEAVEQAFQETVNRVARDVRVAYYDLGLAGEAAGLVRENRQVLGQFLRIAESRYAAGQGTQADALKRLERNGLVTRTVLPTAPIGVEYAITPLGHSLRQPFEALCSWALDNGAAIEAANYEHDSIKPKQ